MLDGLEDSMVRPKKTRALHKLIEMTKDNRLEWTETAIPMTPFTTQYKNYTIYVQVAGCKGPAEYNEPYYTLLVYKDFNDRTESMFNLKFDEIGKLTAVIQYQVFRRNNNEQQVNDLIEDLLKE